MNEKMYFKDKNKPGAGKNVSPEVIDHKMNVLPERKVKSERKMKHFFSSIR